MFNSCVPNHYKKWLTLVGGFLIQFTMGTLYSASNMNIYLIVYRLQNIKIKIKLVDFIFNLK